ncbi:MAG: hypothetical protein AAF628_26035 [Planctomycetota bacterium]
MTAADSRVDRIVNQLLEKPLTKEERIGLLKELVEQGADLPDEVVTAALQKLMERLTE